MKKYLGSQVDFLLEWEIESIKKNKPNYTILFSKPSISLSEFILAIHGYGASHILGKPSVRVEYFPELAKSYEQAKRDMGAGLFKFQVVENRVMIRPGQGLGWIKRRNISVCSELEVWIKQELEDNAKEKQKRNIVAKGRADDLAQQYWKANPRALIKDVAEHVRNELIEMNPKHKSTVGTISKWISHLDRRSPDSKTGPKRK